MVIFQVSILTSSGIFLKNLRNFLNKKTILITCSCMKQLLSSPSSLFATQKLRFDRRSKLAWLLCFFACLAFLKWRRGGPSQSLATLLLLHVSCRTKSRQVWILEPELQRSFRFVCSCKDSALWQSNSTRVSIDSNKQ